MLKFLSSLLYTGLFVAVLLPVCAVGQSGGQSAGQSYLKLHEKAIVVDTHNDVLTTATFKWNGHRNGSDGKDAFGSCPV